jgi:hypothetical protein
MARGQVAARIEGDIYQGMFFWLQAADLLRPQTRVSRVTIENDHAAGVDDVSVHYEPPGIDAGCRLCSADFFQIKYHVDRSSAYSSSTVCEPANPGAKRSLLQRFHDAHLKIGTDAGWHRLSLVSNWRWADEDGLGPLLRESDEGALPEALFSAGSRTALGKIRGMWRDHLSLTADAFEDFARRLRLQVDFLGRRGMRERLNDRLSLAGLREIPADQAQNPYDSLTQQFIISGANVFVPKTFRAMCEKEGLLAGEPTAVQASLGVRSFMRFAERIESECSAFVCVTKYFEGRHVREQSAWNSQVLNDVRAFLCDPAYRTGEYRILLDCHLSIAFLAGYELDRKSGVTVFPVQKGLQAALWKPTTAASTEQQAEHRWAVTTRVASSGGADVALAVSVTRDVLPDVQAYLASLHFQGAVVDVRPTIGTGPQVIRDATHAVALADALVEVIRGRMPTSAGRVHLFLAVPNALAFFVGQHRGALGKLQLYEFDLERCRSGSYAPSFSLPYT